MSGGLALGVLAGGQGRRVGGRDKAWLARQGRSQLEHLLAMLPVGAFSERLASVRSDDPRWQAFGFRCVSDLRPGFGGPLAGLEALATASRSDRLLALPVDALDLPADLLPRLRAACTSDGAWLRDRSGLQPLIGLWRTSALRAAAASALDRGEHAVHRALAVLSPAELDISPAGVGNANTPADFDPT
ncbi:molybdenum cofactor guanylyltransferase [Arenimonas fontis]|uniref:molybdenum cofactor guanylyltransferase n=1 Tax=Arenimonas fontis TaxID=2608255 RepID=UPI001661E8E6|nr:NTP transferase domain-containing protein [Arenimonas fontis]